jgi:hypothetical protein
MLPAIINILEQFFHSGVDDVRAGGILLAEAAVDLPTEVVVIIGTVVTAIIGGISYVGRWAFSQSKEALTQSEKRVAATENWLVEEKAARKEDRDTHNKRMDSAIEGIASLTRTLQESTAANKAFNDGHQQELRRLSDGFAQISAAIRATHKDSG